MYKNLLIILIVLLFLTGCMPFFKMINVVPSSKTKELTFSETATNPKIEFYYSDTTNNDYLRELRQTYGLDTLTDNIDNEFDKIKIILEWTNSRWEHNGSNNPSNPDALTILKEAQEGNNYRCVEYGIVVSSALNSIDIKARVLGLKTRDVEKVKFGAGHVAAEVYSTDFNKWIFIDPQFNIIPMLNDIPLNAVEFQNAILNNPENLKLINAKGDVDEEQFDFYIDWIAKYLFYLDVLFDQSIGKEIDYKKIDGMAKITLVPEGEEEPHIFQRKGTISNSLYTNSINDFYISPK